MKHICYFSFSVVVLVFAYCLGHSGSGDARGPSRIAFDTFRHGSQEIYVMDANDPNPTSPMNSAGSFFPKWSPDKRLGTD